MRPLPFLLLILLLAGCATKEVEQAAEEDQAAAVQALPPQAVALPPQAVALPPQAVALPPQAVALPPQTVALPAPVVEESMAAQSARGGELVVYESASRLEMPSVVQKSAGAWAMKSSASAAPRAPAGTAGASEAAYSVASGERLESYGVQVSADEIIRIPGPPGELRVWIGDPAQMPGVAPGMRGDEATIPALSNTARVTPHGGGLEVKPPESRCVKIHPSGSTVVFELHATRQGRYKVGADVNLYETADCSGTPIPKAGAEVLVEVQVDRKEDFIAEFWKALLDFWKELLGLAFGLLLFLLRKQIFKLFGYEQKKD